MLLSVVECLLVGEEVVDTLVPSHLCGTRPAEVGEHDKQHPLWKFCSHFLVLAEFRRNCQNLLPIISDHISNFRCALKPVVPSQSSPAISTLEVIRDLSLRFLLIRFTRSKGRWKSDATVSGSTAVIGVKKSRNFQIQRRVDIIDCQCQMRKHVRTNLRTPCQTISVLGKHCTEVHKMVCKDN